MHRLHQGNSKYMLNKWCRTNRFTLPNYSKIRELPKNQVNSDLNFEVDVSLRIFQRNFTAHGLGRSHKLAKTDAATALCTILEQAGYDIDQEIVSLKKSLPTSAPSIRTTGQKRKFDDYSASPNARVSEKFSFARCKKARVDATASPECSKNGQERPEVDQDVRGDPKTLDAAILAHYLSARPSPVEFGLKMQLLQKLNNSLLHYFSPGSAFYIFGSSISCLGSYNSDLDLCFVTQQGNSQQKCANFNVKFEREFSIRTLKKLRSLLYRYFSRNSGHNVHCSAINLIAAKVPILKLSEVSVENLDIEIDINVNNVAGLRNSHLLHYYNMIDRRFGALVLAIKHWAIKADVSCPANGTLGGLSLTLMVVHLLQRSIQGHPPILPDLQQILPEHFSANTPIEFLRVFNSDVLPMHLIDPLTDSNNTDISGHKVNGNPLLLSDLLLEFFHYYTNCVDFKRCAVSVHEGGCLKPRASGTGKPSLIFIEEPYDRSNCARPLPYTTPLFANVESSVLTEGILQANGYRPLNDKKSEAAAAVRRIWRHTDAVCFDVDSTVCVNEAIDDLADFCGVGAKVADVTRRAMNGDSMSFRDALTARLDLIRPSSDVIRRFVAQHPPRLTPGIDGLVAALHARRVPVFLVTGGFRCIVEPVADLLSIPLSHVFANVLLFDEQNNGSYAGFDTTQPTSSSGGKTAVVASLKRRWGYRRLVSIGDGVTDLETSPPADAFVGFGGNVERSAVKNASDWFVWDFDELLHSLRPLDDENGDVTC